MNELLVELVQHGLWLAVWMAGPPSLAGLAAGLAVSVLQAVTQVQEPALSFVARASALGLTTIGWAGASLRGLVGYGHTCLDWIGRL
jgi:flagellar biosynthesis protein FliQ